MPTNTEEPAATGRLFVALCADAAGRYAHIVVTADSWSHAVDQLEDAGAEVIEDQSEDYEPEDLATMDAREEVGAVALEDLGVTDFIPHAGGN
jgi:threonine dehydratase